MIFLGELWDLPWSRRGLPAEREKEMIGLMGAAAIGLLVGMTLEDKTKDRIADDIKKTLYKLQTGLEYQPWRNNTTFNVANMYPSSIIDEKVKKWNEALTFNDPAQAKEGLRRMKEIASQFGSVSVCDLYVMRDLAPEWTMDKYGWTEKMINDGLIVYNKVHLPKPIALK